jgi:hypothetical protein
MTSALAIDHQRGPELPIRYRPEPQPREKKSPLPPEWSDSARPLRSLVRQLQELLGDR